MRRDEQIRRLVDGELSIEEVRRLRQEAEADPELRSRIESIEGALRALRDLVEVEEPPARLARLSLAAAEQARHEAGGLRRILSPRWIRLRVSLGLVLLPVVLATSIWVVARRGTQPTPPSSTRLGESATARDATPPEPEEAAPGEVPIRFVLRAPGAQRVTVAGDFNGWNPTATTLVDEDGDGVFVGTAYLPRGAWSYAFVVDGERWVTDPYAQNFRDDGFGGRNAVLRIN